jgi:hypothetical protein
LPTHVIGRKRRLVVALLLPFAFFLSLTGWILYSMATNTQETESLIEDDGIEITVALTPEQEEYVRQ